jgi:uncharacterized membrane protein
MTSRLIGAALVAVVLGAVVGYAWGAPGSGVIWTIGLSAMLAGAAVLSAVLARNVVGLRRVKASRRREPLLQLSTSAHPALRDSAAIRRYRDGAAHDGS